MATLRLAVRWIVSCHRGLTKEPEGRLRITEMANVDYTVNVNFLSHV